MRMREILEQQERDILSPLASFSAATRGRQRPEPPCPLRTAYQRDRDRIIHSKSFRRLKHKTQVFISPEEDHYRTRLTHTLEVAQIARTAARALALNEDLTEAIALGHDLGHTPFGHAGEKALNEIFSAGFHHNEQSLRVVELLEKKPQGLNLTWEVRDGILHHTGDGLPQTLEGQIVKIADRIAYINHDIDDAVRAGLIKDEDLPADCIAVLGDNNTKRINLMVRDLIANSWEKDRIQMSPEVKQAMDRLREYLFAHVYFHEYALHEEEKAIRLIKELFCFLLTLPEYENKEREVCDYIAGMTDRYILIEYKRYFFPNTWNKTEKNKRV